MGKQAAEDAEVADGEDVDVDHMAQTMNNCNQNGSRSRAQGGNPAARASDTVLFHRSWDTFTSRMPTCKNDGSHGHQAMEVDGRVEGDVSVEEGLAAQRDEVAAHGEEHVGVQEGDGGRRAAGNDDAHHRSLGDARGSGLQAVI